MTDRSSKKAAEPQAPAHALPADHHYAPTDVDIFAVSERLGPATEEEVRLLTEAYTAPDLVAIGNNYATERVTDDAFRITGTATAFFQQAPADREAVDLTLDVVRVAAWAAAEDARSHARFKSASAGRKSRSAGETVGAQETLDLARAERTRLAECLRRVGQRAATEAAITHALTLAAHGEANTGPDVSLTLLVAEGVRALLASKDAGIHKRAPMFKLTAERLNTVERLAAEAKAAQAVVDAPRVVVTQDAVDWWDGATYVLLQALVAAFQAARATHPNVPRLGFVSLRKQGGGSGGGGGAPGGGGGAPGGGGGAPGGGGGAPGGGPT